MKNARTKLGNSLFELANTVYHAESPWRKKLGNYLFKLAAKVSPDKEI